MTPSPRISSPEKTAPSHRSGLSTEDRTLFKEDSDLSEDGPFSKEDRGSLDDGGEEYQQTFREV